MEKALKHQVPGAAQIIGARNALRDITQRGRNVREAQQATVSPVEQAARDVERLSRKRARAAAYQTLEQSGPTLPQSAPPQPLPIGQVIRPPNNNNRPP
jgi:hypothetical protein